MAGKQEDLMGISRSGRVRKKSSKLLDFESPEEVDLRPKKAANSNPRGKPKKTPEVHSTPIVPPLQIRLPKNTQPVAFKESYDDESSSGDSDDFSRSIDKDDELEGYHEDSNSHIDDDYDRIEQLAKEAIKRGHNSMDEDDSEEHFGDTQSDSEEDVDVAGPSSETLSAGTTKSSLYLMENSKKKIVLKDGKLVAARQKAQRKDKGKTRFTAYMLWCKEMRPSVSQQNPELKFEGVSKRLGELWSTVSPAERLTWKRRAMRMSTKSSGGMISTGVKPKPAASRVKTTVSPKRAPATPAGRGATKAASPTKQRQRFASAEGADNHNDYDNSPTLSSPPAVLQPRAFELEPLDVATHLHLLGESLSVIGTRLKEQNGQIAVSGSLSVLLDSVVCALGPLLCLTRLNPETDGCPPETLSRILDNIAYIMPGL